MQGVAWLVDGAEAFPGLIGIFCMFDKVHFVPWGSSDDFVEGRFIAFDPRFSLLSGLFMFGCIAVTPLGLSCWHMSLMYLYSALYDSCDLIMCTTSLLDAHTGHFHYLDT